MVEDIGDLEPTLTLLNSCIRQLLMLGVEVEGYDYCKQLSHTIHKKSKATVTLLQELLTEYNKLPDLLDCSYLNQSVSELNLCIENLLKVYKEYDSVAYYGRLTNLNQNQKIETKLSRVGESLVEVCESSLNKTSQSEPKGKRVDGLKRCTQTLINLQTSLNEVGKLVFSIAESRKNIIKDVENITEELDLSLVKNVEIEYDEVKQFPGAENFKASSRELIKRIYKTESVVELIYDKNIDKLSRSELLKEVATLNLLKVNKNILKVFGLRSYPNYCGIIMEHCSFGSVYDFILEDKFTQLDYSSDKIEVLKYRFCLESCEAVAFLHASGFLHKNVSPDNLLLTKNLQVKLTGFEFSKDEHNSMSSDKDDLDQFKFRWMPKEYFLKGDQMSSKSDVYSLALTWTFIFEQTTPYLEITDRKVVQKMLDIDSKISLTKVPEKLQLSLRKSLDPTFSSRLSSRELLEILEEHQPLALSGNDSLEQNKNQTTTEINTKFDLSMDTLQAPSPTKNNNTDKKQPGYETRFLMEEEEELANDADPYLPNFTKDSLPSIDSALSLHDSNLKQDAYLQFQHLANYGDPQALYYLGYYHYWGVPDLISKDKDKGLMYFELAAASNNSDALDHLGIHFMDKANKYRRVNDDGPKDYKKLWFAKAFDFFTKSSNLGNVKAHYHLGDCYLKGIGCEKDRSKGLKLIRRAADNGHVLAVNNLKKALAVSLNI